MIQHLLLKICLTNPYLFNMIKQGDRIRIYDDKVKVVFGFHKNGNPLIKNGDTLCQVPLDKCRKY